MMASRTCNFRFLDHTTDVSHVDDIHRDHIEESNHVHCKEKQGWHYLDKWC